MSGVAATEVAFLLDDLASEQEALDVIVSRLDEEQWRTPTDAPGWDVRDQVIHLAFVEELARVSATAPDEFAVEARRGQELETANIARGRQLSGAEVLAWWRRERHAALDALRALAERDENARLAWFGPPMSLRSFVTARLMETWAHGWEVAEAVGARLAATDRLRHIAHLAVSTRRWSYAVRGRTPDDTPVHVELTSPDSEKTWTWGEPHADEWIRGSALDFCLVATQRRHWSETDLVAHGPAAREWLTIAQAFAGPPTQREPRPARELATNVPTDAEGDR